MNPPTQTPQPSQKIPEPISSSPTDAWKAPVAVTQHTPAVQRYSRGVSIDKGEAAWLNLEQVASIIQLHNTHHRIKTTLLQGLQRADWNTVWTHMRATEAAEGEETERPAPRVRDAMLTYGQLLSQHKRDKISGIYPMNIPGHWRVMIVSHVLRQIVLLDPFGNEFTRTEVNNIKQSYNGYTISSRTARLQTDSWNCGVWVAWIASMWATHANQGHEGTKNIDQVIQEGLSAKSISDINTHPSGKSQNESNILHTRQRFRQMIYAGSQPAHLTDWLAEWNTPLREVQSVSAVTHLARAHHTTGPHTPQHMDLTEDAEDTDNTHHRTESSSLTKPSHDPCPPPTRTIFAPP